MKHTAVYLIVFLTIVPCFVFSAGLGQEEGEEETSVRHYPVNLSIAYPISINRTKDDSVNLNISIFYGRVGSIDGLDLSLFASTVTNRIKGVQLCGLVGIAGENGTGIQAAGLACIAGASFNGVQASGLFNIAGDEFTGLQTAGLICIAGKRIIGIQAAGLSNICGERLEGGQAGGLFSIIGERCTGFQAAGLFNVTGEILKGFQAAGLFNVTGETLVGLQAAGLFNVVGNELHGLQAAPCNIAGHSDGVQIGIVNICGTTEKMQIGLVNYSKHDNIGVPFGPVNIAGNGRIRGILWGGTGKAVSGGAKFMVGRIYSILSLGAVNLNDNISGSLAYGFHYGMWFPSGRLILNADVGYRYRDNKTLFRHSIMEPDQHLLEARLILSLPISPGLSFIFGGGIATRFDVGKPMSSGRFFPLAVAGIEFF